MALLRFAGLLLFLLLAISYAAQVSGENGMEVRTTSGLIEGHGAPNTPSVTEFLGVPFAKPPIGNLRFAAPQAYRATGRYKASAFVGHPCERIHSLN